MIASIATSTPAIRARKRFTERAGDALYKSKEGPKFAGEAATSLVERNMRSTFCGLAFLFAGSLLASSASAGNSGHFGGFRFSPSFHRGAFGHHVGDT